MSPLASLSASPSNPVSVTTLSVEDSSFHEPLTTLKVTLALMAALIVRLPF
jgi:hypothetical protein